jgi:radical SAM superfamily enzyme YgiQ (UPF0313 family)
MPSEELFILYILPRPSKTQTSINVTWAYPNSYLVGTSGLGYQLIWWLLEQNQNLNVFRAFTDYQDPGWQDSELIGFTLSWELDFSNVLSMLNARSVPLLSAERDASHPIVFGGGPVLSANPEPFADFFDVILLGDAEVMIPAFIERWQEIRNNPSREAQLLELAKVEGIYIPALYQYSIDGKSGSLQAVLPIHDGVPERIQKQVYMPPPDYIAHSVMLNPKSSFGNMFLVEVVRSCPQECRFCLASYLTRPFRGANVETLLQKIDLGLQYTKKIGLLGPSVTEHPQFAQIAEGLLERRDVDISVASIRADTIDPLILKMLVQLGQKSVTIALESGSERLRAIMKKNLTETEIHSAMDAIAGSGLSGVKLYGIAGLPEETQADLDETVRLLTQLKKKHRALRITFGISSFVPKAQTPFQWAGRDRESGKKIEYLRKHLSKVGIDVRPESHNWSDIQALLSRGDRRLTPILLDVAKTDGKLFSYSAIFHLPKSYPGAI